MCLGHTHALSGAVTGAAAGELVLHLPLPGTAALAVLTAAWATVPDLDIQGSCAARSLGFLSAGFAWVVHRISGGHRHATHSILGAAVLTAVTWAACAGRHTWPGRITLMFLLAVALAAGFRALHIDGHLGDVLAIAGAAGVTFAGWELALIPVACGLGCVTHIAGDMLTVEGCPLVWPLTARHFGVPAPLSFTTGTWRERLVVAPVLLAVLGLLAFHAVTLTRSLN